VTAIQGRQYNSSGSKSQLLKLERTSDRDAPWDMTRGVL